MRWDEMGRPLWFRENSVQYTERSQQCFTGKNRPCQEVKMKNSWLQNLSSVHSAYKYFVGLRLLQQADSIAFPTHGPTSVKHNLKSVFSCGGKYSLNAGSKCSTSVISEFARVCHELYKSLLSITVDHYHDFSRMQSTAIAFGYGHIRNIFECQWKQRGLRYSRSWYMGTIFAESNAPFRWKFHMYDAFRMSLWVLLPSRPSQCQENPAWS